MHTVCMLTSMMNTHAHEVGMNMLFNAWAIGLGLAIIWALYHGVTTVIELWRELRWYLNRR